MFAFLLTSLILGQDASGAGENESQIISYPGWVDAYTPGPWEFTDLGNLLAGSPAFDMLTYGYEGQSTYPYLDGIWSSRLEVCMDGVPLSSVRDGVLDISLVPLGQGDIVQVIKAPFSAHNTSAIGGQINVIPSRSNSFIAGVGATDEFGLNGACRVIHNWKPFGMRVSGSYLSNPGYRSNDAASRATGEGGFWFSPTERFRITFNGGYTYRARGLPGPAPDTSGSPTSPYDNSQDNLFYTSLGANYSNFENLTLSTLVYYVDNNSRIDTRSILGFYNDDGNPVSFTATDSTRYHDTKLGGKATAAVEIADLLFFTGDLSVSRDMTDATDEIVDYNADTLVNTYSWDGSDTKIGAGVSSWVNIGNIIPSINVRADFSFQSGFSFSPEAGIDAEIIPDKLALYAAYGQGIRTPGLIELFSPYGDINLEPERGQNAMLIARIAPFDLFSFKLSGWWRNVKDMIVYGTMDSIWKYTNLDRVSILGGECDAYFSFPEMKTSGFAGIVYNYAREKCVVPDSLWYSGAGQPVFHMDTVSRDAAFIAPFVVKGNLTFNPWFGGKIKTNLAWTATRINYYLVMTGPVNIGVTDKTIEPGIKWDVGFSQDFLDFFNVEIGVKNVLDTRTSMRFGDPGDLDYPTPPRRFYANLSIGK